MKQIGTLPLTGKIEFEFNPESLKLFEKKIITQLRLEAIISFPDKPDVTRKKITIDVVDTWGPGNFETATTSLGCTGDSDVARSNSMHRAQIYLIDQILNKACWVIAGTLAGAKPIPIMILYYPVLSIGTYSFKKEKDVVKNTQPNLN